MAQNAWRKGQSKTEGLCWRTMTFSESSYIIHQDPGLSHAGTAMMEKNEHSVDEFLLWYSSGYLDEQLKSTVVLDLFKHK